MRTILVLIGVLLVIFFLIYNSLVAKRNQVKNALASIDTMLKKRWDLIPNLVSVVKAYMVHERETLTEITALRSQAFSAGSDNEKLNLNNRLNKALGGIMVAVENYPDLKANQNFLQLQAALNEVEEQLAASRRAYNASINDLNNAVEMFPINIVAGISGFNTGNFLEIDDSDRKNVSVKELLKDKNP